MWKAGDEIFGNYRIDQILHVGLGRIYVAEHLRSKVKVAIRRPGSHPLDESFFSRFVEQAKAWMQLGYHPNIVSCFFVHYIDDVPHLFTEYADGGELREWIEEGRCADLKVGLDLAIQFCHAMTHVHSRGIIHRDLKPSNVLITKKGLLKINDFLIALINRNKGSGLHSPDKSSGHNFCGTIAYASPEQFRDADQVGPESDVYSFGVCLWEMLLGRRPYQNAMEESTLYDPLTLRSEIPKELATFLSQLVSWNPGVRAALGGFKTLQDRFSNIYRELIDNVWISSFMLRSPDPLIAWTHGLALARELGAELVADWLKLGERDVPNQLGIDSIKEVRVSIEDRKMEEDRKAPTETEIVDASKTMDSSKFCWSPNDNTMAYLLENYWDHHVEPPTYMGMGNGFWKCCNCGLIVPELKTLVWHQQPSSIYERAGIAVIKDGQPFKDENVGASRGILARITEDSKSLKWSPDGKYISVISHAGKKLWVVDVESRETRVLHAGNEVFTDYFWSLTSEFIAVIGYREESEHNRYFVRILKNAELTSEVPQAIYNYNQKFHWPGWGRVYAGFAWSPSSERYAVGDNYGFRIFNMDGNLIDESINPDAIRGTMILQWPDESVLIATSYDTGTDYLFNDSITLSSVVGKNGGKINVLHNPLLNYCDYAVSPDRKRYVYLTLLHSNKNGVAAYYCPIGIVDIDEGYERSFGNVAVLSADYHKSHITIRWSPDGSHILFCSDGIAKITGGKDTKIYDASFDPQSIWIMNTDGSNLRKLANGYYASWSYDSSMIAFVKGPDDGEKKLCLIDFKSWLEGKV